MKKLKKTSIPSMNILKSHLKQYRTFLLKRRFTKKRSYLIDAITYILEEAEK